MAELKFAIEGAEAIPFAVAPTIAFALRISGARSVQSIALRCQIMIEATRRRHSSAEQLKMNELFGEPERWSKTLRPLLWTHVQATVPGFENECPWFFSSAEPFSIPAKTGCCRSRRSPGIARPDLRFPSMCGNR
jgi:hypothetical protein